MRVDIGDAGQPNGLVPALGCLCAKWRTGRSRLLCTVYSLVSRQPVHSGGGLKRSEVFPFSSDRVHLGHEDERRAHAMETHTWRCACACACAAALACVLVRWKDSRRRYAGGAREREGLVGLIGDTPLVRIRSLSEATGCEIFAKAEMLNPGGCIKDRVALQIVQEAIRAGKIKPGGLLCEGSAGSTGISLAMVAKSMGMRCFVCMPDDAAMEKVQMIEALGATVQRVRPVSIVHAQHFVNVAKRMAEEVNRVEGEGSALFCDQFENLANFRAHFEGTGPEIWQQMNGKVDAFIAAAGTGGTVAGVSSYLKSKNPKVQAYIIDPPGSSLYNYVERGCLYTPEEAEGKRLRNPFDTITEGIGINRQTKNFTQARLDGAFRGTDREAVEMAKFLLEHDGLFVGSSSAMNCVGAVKLARRLGKGHVILTILCDGGHRHLSKFHCPTYLKEQKLLPQATGLDFINGL